MKKSKRLFRSIAILGTVVVFGLGSFIPSALAGNTISISSDTAVFLSGSGITLILASGSTLDSYSVSTTTLTLTLDATSNVTVKSNNLYTLTNSQNSATQCSASPAYSYLALTVASPTTITITPSTTVACSGTAPVIATFAASPTSITSGQSSTLSWSPSGATTVSIDNGVGSQSNASSSSVIVSPTQTTTYTLTAVNYVGTTTAQAIVTVSAPPTGGGGGGGGGIVSPPTITSFTASPSTVSPSQAATLSWLTSGAVSISIVPNVSTNSLNALTGTATVTPVTTTLYTLVAANSYGQTISTTTTVNVTVTPVPSQIPPPVSGPGGQTAPTTSVVKPAYCLVDNDGTFVLILSGVRHGIANPGLLRSYGYGFGDAITDTAAYEALPSGSLLGPQDGALVKTANDPTVYLISGGTRHGFTSASVFHGLGYSFSSVLTIPAPQLDILTVGSIISNANSSHLPGSEISSKGTIYYIGTTARYPYPSLSVFNTWNLHNNFSRVLPANAADLVLPVGQPVIARTSCS